MNVNCEVKVTEKAFDHVLNYVRGSGWTIREKKHPMELVRDLHFPHDLIKYYADDCPELEDTYQLIAAKTLDVTTNKWQHYLYFYVSQKGCCATSTQ